MSIATLTEARMWLGLTAPYDANDTFVLNILLAATDRIFADFLGYSVAQATRTEYYPPRTNLTQRDSLVDGYERSGSNKVVPVDRFMNDRRIILLRHVPVIEVVAVYENPSAWLSDPPDFAAEYLLTAGSGYALDKGDDDSSRTGFLVRNTGPWSVAERCVKVTYTAGYTEEQLGDAYAHIKYAYLNQIQITYNTVKIHRIAGQVTATPGLKSSESLGDWSASYDTATNAKLYGMTNRLAPAVADILEDYVNYANFVF
jgi:hypothetical protein